MINGREKLGKYLKRILAVALAAAVISPASLGSVAQAAAKTPTLSITKTTNVVIGDKLTVGVKNKISGSKYAWSSSNKKIASVNSKGVVTAVKVGTATITCKVTAPRKTYTLKGKVKVVDQVVVATQAQLNKALKKTNLSRITIKTNKAVNFTIPAGTYSKTLLLVDAPKSDVTNSARFKSIVIDQIKADTFTERGKGNSFNLRAPYTNLVIGTGAEVNNISLRGKEANIKVNGDVKGKVTFVKGASAAAQPSLTISGSTKNPVEVVVDNAGAKVKTSVKTHVKVNANNVDLAFEKGAEDSDVLVAENVATAPKVDDSKVDGTVNVKVEDKTPETPPTNNGGGGSGGGDNGGNTVDQSIKTYSLGKSLNDVVSMTVNVKLGVGTASFDLTGQTLDYVKMLLANDAEYITKWNTLGGIVETEKVSDDMTVIFGEVTGTTRKVTFTGKNISASFYVTLKTNAIDVKLDGSNVTYTLSKVDNSTLKIKTSETVMPNDKVSFTNIK